MHEQRLQSDWGTGSFGRTDASHAAKLCTLSGDYGSWPKQDKKLFANLRKHAIYFAV